MKLKSKYTVAIIGSGQIVSGYDSPEDGNIFTHCHALLNHPRFDIIGVFDIDNKKLDEAARKWRFTSAYDFNKLLLQKPDIFVIAVPDNLHSYYLLQISENKPLLVVCEKPLTTSLSESENIIKIYREKGIQLVVNYQRRFDTDINLLKDKFNNGEFGKYLTGSVIYSKGILHNGSHAIDLLRYFFGDIVKLDKFSSCFDFVPEDPSISGRLVFPVGEVFLMIGNENCYSTFEIDLLFEKARYKFTNSGLDIEIFKVEDDPIFKDYKLLILKEKRPSTLNRALGAMWDEVANALINNMQLRNSAFEALQSQIICNKLISGEQ